ncbi:protochlorophyllide-dependent translocon component 52, chloroplastic-like [Lotus japonicus]|uniref:protochlorophyllide-dependent translocon component 52, chloroplastic-like n=1 Tax=Lotus japonicus TaxID=34305 RepID=UPI00258A1201|nr:protochlorophyllide-dependent translocon component 52, chloroplastic-like [Lotus japonicus]
MEAAVAFSVRSLHIPTPLESSTPLRKSMFLSTQLNPPLSLVHGITSKSKLFTALSPTQLTEESSSNNLPEDEPEVEANSEKFDWYSQWYPLMPICDLDKRAPHAKKVLGIDVVVWWDRNEGAWQVFDDACPHRLAPLSEGRIDQWGRLQCVYHGWCFNGSGDCKFIPQAPPEGPPVHTFKKACVAAYPSTVQNDILWFWPNTDPQYKDIIERKRPPYIPELDDPSYTRLMGNRDITYGYEVLIENLMDPSHVPYAHYGLMRTQQPKVKVMNSQKCYWFIEENRDSILNYKLFYLILLIMGISIRPDIRNLSPLFQVYGMIMPSIRSIPANLSNCSTNSSTLPSCLSAKIAAKGFEAAASWNLASSASLNLSQVVAVLLNYHQKADREGGRPLELSIEKLDINGFSADQGWSKSKFMPPCIFYAYTPDQPASSAETKKPSFQKKFGLIFICVPVSPGNSRLIWCFPRNFGLWIDKIVPRWMFHVGQNLILDSDLYLLHLEKGAFSIAAKTNAPVVPITLIGTGQIMPPGWEGIVNPGSVKVVIHKPIDGKDAEMLCKEARKAIASVLTET